MGEKFARSWFSEVEPIGKIDELRDDFVEWKL